MDGVEQGVLGGTGIPKEGSPRKKCGVFVANRLSMWGAEGRRLPTSRRGHGPGLHPSASVPICNWAGMVLTSLPASNAIRSLPCREPYPLVQCVTHWSGFPKCGVGSAGGVGEGRFQEPHRLIPHKGGSPSSPEKPTCPDPLTTRSYSR